MRTTTRTPKLAALFLAVLGGQVALATAASAQGGLLGILAPPPAPPAQAAPAQAAPAPAAPAAPAAPSLQQVEQRLAALGYDVGPADGTVDDQTASAVLAFQKVYGLERTGALTEALSSQVLATSTAPPPMVANGEPNRVEVSLARQVLYLYEGGALTKILAVSSGTSATPTPTGEFRFYRYDSGWHTSRLGRLYNAEYFVGGYAIHGSLSVPAQPASHGCIRISMSAAEWFPSHVTKGIQVVVLAN
jgi:peptidoglycan hydrolase-like protein with peptidoglycan-binding domain